MDSIKTVKLFKSLTEDTTKLVLVSSTSRPRWFTLSDEQGYQVAEALSFIAGDVYNGGPAVMFRPFMGKTPGWVAEIPAPNAQTYVAKQVNAILVDGSVGEDVVEDKE